MARDPKKRQKKLAKHNAKRKEKHRALVRKHNVGLPDRLMAASKFPVVDCWIGDNVADQGMGQVLLSRELPDGNVAVAVFLVDSSCLGVKDAFAELLPRSDYNDKYRRKLRSHMPMYDAEPAAAKKLLEGAVEYAHNIGFRPHPDYERAVLLFGPVNAADSEATFTFGRDGKPCFIAGPHDTPARCRQVLAILDKTCGPGNYEVMLPMGGPVLGPDELPLIGPEDLEDEPDEEAEEGEDE